MKPSWKIEEIVKLSFSDFVHGGTKMFRLRETSDGSVSALWDWGVRGWGWRGLGTRAMDEGVERLRGLEGFRVERSCKKVSPPLPSPVSVVPCPMFLFLIVQSTTSLVHSFA